MKLKITYAAILLALAVAPAWAQGIEVRAGGTVTIAGGGRVRTETGNDVTADGGTVELTTATSDLEVGRDLTITATAGSTLTSAGVAGNISVRGNWSNSGTFTPGLSGVTFDGSGAQTINKVVGGVTANQTETFYNLRCNKSAGTLTTFDSGAGDDGDRFSTINNLSVVSGTLDLDPDAVQIEHTVNAAYSQSGGSLKADTSGTSSNLTAHLNVVGSFTVTSGTFTGSTGTITQEINVGGTASISTAWLYHGWLRMRGPPPNASDDFIGLTMSGGAKVRVLHLWLQEPTDTVSLAGTFIGEYVTITTGVLDVPAAVVMNVQDQADAGFTSGDASASDVLGVIRFDGNTSTTNRAFSVSGGTVNAYAVGTPSSGSNDGWWQISSGTVNLTKSPAGYKGSVTFQNNDDAGDSAPQINLTNGGVNLAGDWSITDADPGATTLFSTGSLTVNLNGSLAQSITHSPEAEAAAGEGVGFYNLNVTNTGAAAVTLQTSAQVKKALTINDGTFVPASSITITMGTAAAIGSVNVTAAGELETNSVVGTEPKFTAASAAFRQDFFVNGTLDVFGLIFEYGDLEGMDLKAGSTLVQLDNITFQNIDPTAGSRHLSITSAAMTLYSTGCVFAAVGGGQYNVRGEDSTGGADAGGDVHLYFENKNTPSSTPNGAGAGEAYDYDDDADGDNFSETGEGQWPGTDRGALVKWSYAYPSGGNIVGYPQGALNLSTYAWYSTYTAINGSQGTSYVLVSNLSGTVVYTFGLSQATFGDIVGGVWWDNDADTGGPNKWVYFGTSNAVTNNAYLWRVLDDPTAQTLTLGWVVNLTTGGVDTDGDYDFNDAAFALGGVPCVEVTSAVVSDGARVYFGGRQNAVPTYRMYAVADGAAPPPGWTWSTNPVTATAVRAAPGLLNWGGTSWLYAGSDVTGGSAHLYKITASSGAISQDNTTSKAHDIKAPIVLGGISIATMRAIVGDYGGRMHMVDADSTGFSDYSGFPYLWPGHALGAVSIRASALFDWVEEYTYYGDSDGHFFIISEGPPPALVAPYPPAPYEAGQAITAAPLYESPYIYTGNANGKVFVITKTTAVLWKQLECGAGVTVGDMAYIIGPAAGPGDDRIAFNASNGITYYMTLPP